MRVLVVTPAAPVIDLEDAKIHLRVHSDDEDALIEAYVAAATGHIDGPDGWLGRAIGVQTLEARCDHFGCEPMRLPYPPVISIASVKYLAADGVEQTVAADQYEMLGSSLAPVYGEAWPFPRSQREAVRIRYQAGYAELPAPIRAAILLMVGDLYANRETAVTGTIAAAIPMSTTVEALLAPYRVWA